MVMNMQEQDILLVDRNKYVLAHCISASCALGKGLALKLAKVHKRLESDCKGYSSLYKRKILGHALRYKDDIGVVYNLFTKTHFSQKAGEGMTVSEYHKNLRLSLESLKAQMLKRAEAYLAIPLLGCGLDKCEWEDVEAIVADVFKDTGIEILVCVLPE